MGRLGCLAFLPMLAVVIGEIYVAVLVNEHLIGDALATILLLMVMSYLGYRLARYRGQKIAQQFMMGQGGAQVVGIIGAIMLAIPGFATGVSGLVLQIPLVQKLFQSQAQRLLQLMAKNAMQQFAGKAGGNPFGAGGANPFGGGANPFGAAGGNPFAAGGFAAKAKGGANAGQSAAGPFARKLKKDPPGKTIDTTATKD